MPDDEELREELARGAVRPRLPSFAGRPPRRRPPARGRAPRGTADSGALREAAVSMDRKGHPYCPCSRRLRDRADTLDGKP
jgi:hypothetical protein